MGKVKTSREAQAVMRVGSYGIRLIPGNIIVGKYLLIATGPKAGTEEMTASTQSYHVSYYRAVCNLYDRLVADGTFDNNTVVVKGLIDAEKAAYKMIEEALSKIEILPARVSI